MAEILGYSPPSRVPVVPQRGQLTGATRQTLCRAHSQQPPTSLMHPDSHSRLLGLQASAPVVPNPVTLLSPLQAGFLPLPGGLEGETGHRAQCVSVPWTCLHLVLQARGRWEAEPQEVSQAPEPLQGGEGSAGNPQQCTGQARGLAQGHPLSPLHHRAGSRGEGALLGACGGPSGRMWQR